MRIMALIAFSVMLMFLLYLISDGVSAEKVSHGGEKVDISGDPIYCVSCHDGSGAAPDARYCTSNCSAVTSHSILRDYPPALKEDSYAPAESLRDRGILLFEGKTTCISCHDLRNTNPKHLIFDNSGSTLCFGCHRI